MNAKTRLQMFAILAVILSGATLVGVSYGAPANYEANQDSVFFVGTVDVDTLPEIQPWKKPIQTHPATLSHQRGTTRSSASSPATRFGLTATVSNTVVSASTGFEGLAQFQSCDCVPPDVQVAAGPNHIMEMVNLAGAIYTKEGFNTNTFLLSSFFLTGNDFISDPKVLFDAPSDRWFATILRCAGPCFSTGVDSTMVAVSTTNNPAGLWRIYTVISGTGRLPDQPLIGISDDKFVISANIYSDIYLGAQWWVLNKNDIVTGATSPRLQSFGPFGNLESVYPVHSLSPTTTQYMVTVGASDLGTSSGSVRVFSITGVPGVQPLQTTNVSLAVQTITDPPDGNQPGVADIDTIDRRVQSTAWRQGKAWLGLNSRCISNSQRACVRLIQVNTAQMSVPQDFDHDGSGKDFYFPALTIDSQGSLLFIYGFSSSTIYPSLAITGQHANDPAGSLAQPKTIKSGTRTGGALGRYGDYFGAGLDPADAAVAWVAGQYQSLPSSQSCDVFASACWQTFIDSISFLDFVISAGPTSVTFNPGSTATSTITITSLNGFTGNVTLTRTVSPSVGLTVSCNPNTLVLGAMATSTCTFSSSTPGAYTVTVTGGSGPRAHSTSITANVFGFGISSNKSPIILSAGSSTTATITVTSFGGFSGTVNLTSSIFPTVNSGPSASLNPPSVTISAGQSRTSTLSVSTTSSTPKGIFDVLITGTSGSLSWGIVIDLAVTPITLNINSASTFSGVTVTTTGTLTVDSPSTSLTVSGTPSVIATNASTGATLFSRTYSISKLGLLETAPAKHETKFLLPVYVAPYTLSSKVAITIQVGNASSSVLIRRNLDINNNGFVDGIDLDTVTASMFCQIGNPCYNSQADIDADGDIDIDDQIAVFLHLGTSSSIPDFRMTASPSTISFPALGGPRTSTITLTSINGFFGTVTMTTVVYRNGLYAPFSGLSTSLNPVTVTLSQGGTGTVTLTVDSGVQASYTVYAYGTSGSLSRSASLSVTVTPCISICPQ